MASQKVQFIALIVTILISETISVQDLCEDSQFDTIFSTSESKVYIFKGTDYWLLTPKTVGDGYQMAVGYPKPVNSYWKELPTGIDASFTNYREGKTYFFKGGLHWRYSDQILDAGYPKPISQGFKNIPSDLDLGFVCTGVNYFSKGEDVWNVHRSSPRPVSQVWTGLPNHLTSAVQLPNAAHTYFFKGTQFYKLKRSNQAVEITSPPYPHSNKDFWFDCTEGDEELTLLEALS